MIKYEQASRKREIPIKREDALEKSKYSIVQDRKETKSSLEKSKRGLLVHRIISN